MDRIKKMWPFKTMFETETDIEVSPPDKQMQAQQADRHIQLREAWDRIESVSDELWDENSPGALKLRIALKEFRTEVEKAEEIVYAWHRALHEERKKNHRIGSEARTLYEGRIQDIQGQLELAQAHEKSMSETLKRERTRIGELLQKVEEKDTENADFKEKFLETESDRDHAHAEKMTHFIKDMQEKEASMEKNWAQRHQALETEYSERHTELHKDHEKLLASMKSRALEMEKHSMQKIAELEASYETARRELDVKGDQNRKLADELQAKEASLKAKETELETAITEKHRKLDAIKRRMDEELHEILKDYKERLGAAKPKEKFSQGP